MVVFKFASVLEKEIVLYFVCQLQTKVTRLISTATAIKILLFKPFELQLQEEAGALNDSAGRVNGGAVISTMTTSPDVVYSCPAMTELKEGHSFYIRGRVLKTCER